MRHDGPGMGPVGSQAGPVGRRRRDGGDTPAERPAHIPPVLAELAYYLRAIRYGRGARGEGVAITDVPACYAPRS